MLKKAFKWLLISSCALLLCGVFIIYVIESIDAILSEQAEGSEHAERESKSAQAKTAPESQPDRPVSTDRHDVAVAGIPENSPWRVIELSESHDNQLQYYSPHNVNFDDGHVAITTHEELIGNKRYTSGMVESKHAYLYGKFSFVISVSEGKGLFPAIWLMPAENKALPEIDIFEMIGSAPDEFYGVVHYMDGSAQARDFFKTKVARKDTYLIEFEWTRESLRWFIDGECKFETSKCVPDEPMYLIVNQAVGGQWPGVPDENTLFPATFILKSWAVEPEWSQPR
jgi:beta-glucanase (GH16 family)